MPKKIKNCEKKRKRKSYVFVVPLENVKTTFGSMSFTLDRYEIISVTKKDIDLIIRKIIKLIRKGKT